jgi:hypothetical protein
MVAFFIILLISGLLAVAAVSVSAIVKLIGGQPR